MAPQQSVLSLTDGDSNVRTGELAKAQAILSVEIGAEVDAVLRSRTWARTRSVRATSSTSAKP